MSDVDTSLIHSNTFLLEFPKGSGQFKEYPEMDAMKWFTYEEAKEKIFSGQKNILDKLKYKLER